MPLEHGEKCRECGHPFDPHIFIPTREMPQQGGIVICQTKGCECLATYDFPPISTEADVVMPTDDELTRLRHILQSE